MLSSASQLLVKNKALFDSGKWLFANPEDADIFNQLSHPVDGFHQYFDQYQQSQQQPGKHVFAASMETAEQYDGAVLYMPKSKEQAKMLLANLASLIKPDGVLCLVGENNSGVKSAPRLLSEYGEHVVKHDSARHCSLFRTLVDKTVAPFRLDSWISEFDIQINGCSLKIASLPGVFNHGALDAGTQLLLGSITNVPAGEVLDFACGAGIVGCYLARQNTSAKVTMSDVSALALHCAQYTASLNNIRAEVIASNGLESVNNKFQAVYSNPPFHTGIKTDYQISELFIKTVKEKLLPQGSLTLVANAFLKYPELLTQHLSTPEVVTETSKFRIYRCQIR